MLAHTCSSILREKRYKDKDPEKQIHTSRTGDKNKTRNSKVTPLEILIFYSFSRLPDSTDLC